MLAKSTMEGRKLLLDLTLLEAVHINMDTICEELMLAVVCRGSSVWRAMYLHSMILTFRTPSWLFGYLEGVNEEG